MKLDAVTLTDLPDLHLEDGNAIYIPPRLSTVQVAGVVYCPNVFRQQRGKILLADMNDAGDATREADRKRIFVIRADGTFVIRQSRIDQFRGNSEKLKLPPEDAIVVPERVRVGSKMSDFLQMTPFRSQLSLSAMTFSVIK